VAISVDSKPTNIAYANAMGITSFPILADFHPKGEVGRKYGLYLEDKGIDARATVVVGKDGRVTWIKVNDLGTQRTNTEILGACSAGAKA
jgi:alkyl hydroperoxide reductase subunit AhpC